jgi:hypothetical protein
MTAPKEQYVKLPRQFLESPARRVLTANEYRALDRILVEHQRKSGFVNSGLPVTKRDFERFGINARYIASCTRVLEALGIIVCTRTRGGSLRGRTPNLWRPTFLPRTPKANDATHDYAKFTLAEAKAIAAAHRIHETRKHRPPPARPRKRPYSKIASNAERLS